MIKPINKYFTYILIIKQKLKTKVLLLLALTIYLFKTKNQPDIIKWTTQYITVISGIYLIVFLPFMKQ